MGQGTPRPATALGSLTSLVAAALVALALVANGCGGTSKGPPAGARTATPRATTNGPSTSTFVAAAEDICKRLNDELPRDKTAHPSIGDIARTAPQNAAMESEAATALGGLVPPRSLASDWSKIVDYRKRLAQELVELARDAQVNDVAAVLSLTASKAKLHERLLRASRHAGFKECSHIGPLRVQRRSSPPAPPAKGTHV
jgi:hypothetical protein